MQLEIRRLHDAVKLPLQATPGSIGLDIHAFLISDTGRANTAMIPPKATRGIRTGLIVKPPENHAVFVCSRSGLAKDYSLFVTNSPGVIDPDYRGEIIVLLYNGGYEAHYIKHEQRIAQLVVLPCVPVLPVEVPSLDLNTARGDRGFGSTGE